MRLIQFNKAKISGFIALIISTSILFSFKPKDVGITTVFGKTHSDSISFIPNVQAGWGSYSSYLQTTGDSTAFELILFYDLPAGGVNWNNTQQIGMVHALYRPVSERIIIYTELPRTWKITIQPDGACFLKLLNGVAPVGSHVVLPIKTKYEK